MFAKLMSPNDISPLANQISGVIRTVVPFLLALLVTGGHMPQVLADAVSGPIGDVILGIITLVFAMWSWKSNAPPALESQLAKAV